MRKKLIIVVIMFLALLLAFQVQNPKASAVVSKSTQKEIIIPKKLAPRARILADYLVNFNSPLQHNAQDFIDAADQYNLDWKMLPAIAGVESTFGKQIPGGFNAWGWGVYGSQAIYFNCWKEAIFTIAKGLRENYLNKGLNNPYEINTIYAASPYWGGRVSYFMNDLDKFSQNQKLEGNLPRIDNIKTAAGSGQLAFRFD